MSAFIYAPLKIPLGEIMLDTRALDPAAERSLHAWARQIIVATWPASLPRTLGGTQLAQANALLESGYGQGWGGACIGSNNWGAVQAGSAPPCGSGSCQYGDTHPGSGGYQWCFKAYGSPQQGCADFLRIMLRPQTAKVINTGNATKVSAAMYAEHYFEGNSTIPKDAISNRAQGVYSRAKTIASALGEPLKVGLDSDAETPPGSSEAQKAALALLVTLGVGLAVKRYRASRR